VLSRPFRGPAGVGEGVPLGLGVASDVLVSLLGKVERGLPAGSFGGVVGISLLGGVHGQASVAAQRFEPFWDRAAWTEGRGRCGFVFPLLLGEGAALGDGGDVGAVDSDDDVEDAAGFGEVITVGDHADLVTVPAAGGRDIQAAASRGGRGEGDAVGTVADWYPCSVAAYPSRTCSVT
jgi:hypothetical protein